MNLDNILPTISVLKNDKICIFRNIFPDNIVQAAFQQAHTVYAQPTNMFAKNATENDTLPALVRVVSYRLVILPILKSFLQQLIIIYTSRLLPFSFYPSINLLVICQNNNEL